MLCTDRNHVKYIRRYFKNIHQVDFLPHAGVELGSRHKPLAERGIDVLYAGALPIYTVAKMIPDLSSIPEVDGQLMAGDVLAELVHHPDRTTEEVIEEYLKDRRSDIPDKRVQEIIVQIAFYRLLRHFVFQGAGGAYSGGKRNPGHGVRYGMGSVRVERQPVS